MKEYEPVAIGTLCFLLGAYLFFNTKKLQTASSEYRKKLGHRFAALLLGNPVTYVALKIIGLFFTLFGAAIVLDKIFPNLGIVK